MKKLILKISVLLRKESVKKGTDFRIILHISDF